MNDAQRARKLLTYARKHVDRLPVCEICSAIALGVRRTGDDQSRDVGDALAAWIADMLDGCRFYTGWLRAHHYELYTTTLRESGREFDRQVQRGRLAWIDWMLEQDLSKIVEKYKPIV